MRALIAALCLLCCAAPLHAQRAPRLSISGVQGITFGTLLPGLSRVVPRTDAAGAGRFDLAGKGNAGFLAIFTLPSAMSGPGGATLPLVFGAADGGYSQRQTIADQTVFNPNYPFFGQLKGGGGSIFLGGSARAGAAQTPGTYTGTITLTIIVL